MPCGTTARPAGSSSQDIGRVTRGKFEGCKMHTDLTVEVIFFQAPEASSEVERTAILDQACLDDDSLRRRVEDLLAAHLQMGQFLEHSLIESHARRGILLSTE